jgi:hypothetical protein
MNTSDTINEIAGALAKAQGAMKPAVKDANNPHFKSKYADLASNVEAARAPLADNGIAVLQEATTGERGISVATRLVHSSGQWIAFDPLTVPLSKQDAHGVGSALTYARRYALGAALGLVAEDDDGNAAVSHPPQTQTRALPQAAPKGYAKWLEDFEKVADNGSEALQSAWGESEQAFRTYMKANDNAKLEDLKKKAAKKASHAA